MNASAFAKGVFSLAVFGFLFCSCSRQPKSVAVEFWDSQFVATTNYVFDSLRQLKVIQDANPEDDARRAVKSHDCRLVATKFFAPYFSGFPYDDVAEAMRQTYGFKVIASSRELEDDQKFVELKDAYVERYNRTLYITMFPTNTVKLK